MRQLLSSLSRLGWGRGWWLVVVGMRKCHRDQMEASFALSQGELGLSLKI